jgi:G3E family GTPase
VIEALVLTGFLGSGKTTLLGHLLRQPEFSHTAVIINEFGEVGLDHELIEASEDSLIELATGCLCCKLRNDIATTICDLLQRRDQGKVTPFSRVVIETSGLADPAPILQTMMTDATIAARIAVAGVVATVDAVNRSDTLFQDGIFIKQVALADRLVVTKTDLADAKQSLIRRIRALNATAPIFYANHGQIDARRLFDGTLHDAFVKSFDVRSQFDTSTTAQGHAHGGHDVNTFAILRREPIRAVALTLLLEALSDHCGADLLRLKGIVNILESPDQPAVIHGVQHVFHPPSWLPRWPSDDRRSRIVFITRGVPRRWVELLLDAIDAEVAAVSSKECCSAT